MNDANEETCFCGGCGETINSEEAVMHGGVPFCDVCEDAPAEE